MVHRALVLAQDLRGMGPIGAHVGHRANLLIYDRAWGHVHRLPCIGLGLEVGLAGVAFNSCQSQHLVRQMHRFLSSD